MDTIHPYSANHTKKRLIQCDDVIQHTEPPYWRVPTCDKEQFNRPKLLDKPPPHRGGGDGERGFMDEKNPYVYFDSKFCFNIIVNLNNFDVLTQ